MRYKKLGRHDIDVSIVGQGTWAMGADAWGDVDDSQSIDVIRQGVDAGINLIDTAPVYGWGHSETIVGKAIKGLRDKVLVSTKCGLRRSVTKGAIRLLTPESIREEIEDSLRRMDTEYIDIYFLHYPDPDTPLELSLGEMERLRKEGKIRYIGLSNFDIRLMEEANNIAQIDCIQPQYSILSRKEEQCIKYAEKQGIGIMTYGSLAAGLLAGKVTEPPDFGKRDARQTFYPFYREPMFSKSLNVVDVMKEIADKHNKPISSVAINWVVQQTGITTALVGSSKSSHLLENIAAASWELTEDELKLVERAYEVHIRNES